MPLTHGYADNSRGMGVADMACAIRTGRPHRASGELAYHVLDIMHAFHDASQTGRHYELASTFKRPAGLPVGLADGEARTSSGPLTKSSPLWHARPRV